MLSDQPTVWKSGDAALYDERLESRGTALHNYSGRGACDRESIRTYEVSVFVTDGASAFSVDAWDLCVHEIPAALLPSLLSNEDNSLYQPSSLHPLTKNDDPWSWLSPTGLPAAMEDAVPVVADAVHHLVGYGGKTARLINDIYGVVAGVGY